ncbi:MAG: hypothetical protein R3263_01025 [Myxococcota bacterium]|nr:hypothetical protein [Myxococcota bacterium]
MKRPDTASLSSSPDVGATRATPLARRLVPALYGVADVRAPAPPGRGGGGDVDVAPEVARRLRRRGPAAARRAHLALLWLEWSPVVGLRARRPFSRLPRKARARALARLRQSRLPPLRRAVRELEALVDEALAAAGVAAGGPHSSDGA